jgi:hypothetical protein
MMSTLHPSKLIKKKELKALIQETEVRHQEETAAREAAIEKTEARGGGKA